MSAARFRRPQPGTPSASGFACLKSRKTPPCYNWSIRRVPKMSHFARRFLTVFGVVCLMFAASVALAEKRFSDSEDAREKDEPQKFLPDYDKLVKGSNADWVFFPDGGLSKYKTVSVGEFDHT